MSIRFSTSGGAPWLTPRKSLAICASLLICACASAPPEKPDTGTASAPAGQAGVPGAAGASAPGAAGLPPARAAADFDRAVGFMRSGNTTEAELEFKQMSLAYPQLSAPFVNLGILYRKAGRLDQSEAALKSAVDRNGSNAIAWNELGATQRLRGKFPDAAASYEKAIAADSNFAPAYRNLGVVSDLYLGDPERALTALERYKELTGEDRPVTSWIAELRQRTGKPAVKPAAKPAQAPDANATSQGATPEGAATPQNAAPQGPAGGSPKASPEGSAKPGADGSPKPRGELTPKSGGQ